MAINWHVGSYRQGRGFPSMNRSADTLFSSRPTVTLELPLAKNNRILHPEQVILKIGRPCFDLGAFCYTLRSPKRRKPGQPCEVVLSSLYKPRLKQVGLLIHALSRLKTDSGKSFRTVDGYAGTIKQFLDWADAGGRHDCLAGGDATLAAYQAWAADTREGYQRQEFSELTHNDRIFRVRELLEAMTGLDGLGRGIRRVKEKRNANGGTEPLAHHDFAHALALNECLFDGLCDLLLDDGKFPFRLELPASLGWAQNHLWVFPTHLWRLPPHQWGAAREKLLRPSWAHDYETGRIVTDPNEIAHRYGGRLPCQRKGIAKAKIRSAQARLDAANGDPRDRYRIMLGMIAQRAFLFLFASNSAGNEATILTLETDGQIDAASAAQSFRELKFRASGKEVTLTVPVALMPRLRRYMELRRYLLDGKPFPYLFFTFGSRNAKPPARIERNAVGNLYENVLRTLDPQLSRMGPRILRASAADWYQCNYDLHVTARVLQNSPETAAKKYDAGSPTDYRDEMSLLLATIADAAKRQKVIQVEAVNPADKEILEGGRCDDYGNPESLVDNPPVKPDCKDSQGCLFCRHRLLVADEDTVRKVASAAWVTEAVILGPLHEAALRPLIEKCSQDLEKIAAFRNSRDMVERVRRDVYVNGNLTHFFADKYQLFLELGVIK